MHAYVRVCMRQAAFVQVNLTWLSCYPVSPYPSHSDRHNVTVATFDSNEKPGIPKPHRFVRQKEFELPVGTIHSKPCTHVKEYVSVPDRQLFSKPIHNLLPLQRRGGSLLQH